MERDYSKLSANEIEKLPYMQGKFASQCKELNISGAQLANMCDKSPNFMSSLGDYTTTLTVSKLKSSIPKLSLNWLIMDEGPMLEEREKDIIAPVDVIKLQQQVNDLYSELQKLKNSL